MADIINKGEYAFFQKTNYHDVRFALRFPIHMVAYNPEPVKISGFGYTENRRALCKDKQFPQPIIYTQAEFDAFPEHTTRIIYCERCWKRYHKLLGVPVPEQNKPKPLEEYDILPTQPIVRIVDGLVQFPHVIIQRRDGAGRPEALDQRDLRKDGNRKEYLPGHQLGVTRLRGHLVGQWAYYNLDREEAAKEVRSEIARLKRELAEAEQHLLEVYEEENP